MSETKNLRAEITRIYDESKPARQSFLDYSTKMLALSVEYHKAAIQEKLGVDMQSGVVVAALDVRETPASADKALDELKAAGVPITGAIHDIQEAKIYLFKV